MNIVILGCGYIANRVASGIKFSKARLYGFASRDKEKAMAYTQKYEAVKSYTYEECFKDENVDLIYITTPHPTHYEYVLKALQSKKHVICEKPFVSSKKEVKELFLLAKKQDCFLMEAHKTCFIPINQLLLSRINEIGKIKTIEASFISSFDEQNCKDWNIDENMGGSFYDLGVYSICFSNLFANSEIKKSEFVIKMYKNGKCDRKCEYELEYKNGISTKLLSCWRKQDYNFGVGKIVGDKGRIEVENFWKNTSAKIVLEGKEEIIKVEQASDFTPEINHAYECIKNGKLESPIMSQTATEQIVEILEKMKEKRKCMV